MKIVDINEFENLLTDEAKIKAIYYGILALEEKINQQNISPRPRKSLPWYLLLGVVLGAMFIGYAIRSFLG